MSPRTFHRTLANDMAGYARLMDAVAAFARDAGIAGVQAVHLELVLEELVINIIRHGYPDGRRGEIAVDMAVNGCLTITLADDGDPFDPLAMPPPDLESSIENRPIGGLGIHFVRSFMDEMHYERRGARNVLQLGKRLAG